MSQSTSNIHNQVNELFELSYLKECRRVDKFMSWLMVMQWCLGIAFAAFYSPLTWIGQEYAIHVHIWAAVLIGGAISSFAICWSRLYAGSVHSRHVMAISQMLWSALLIHLSGGRIETHFHVFASLAILSVYRDWKILTTATVIVAADHFIRGVFYPLSAFGVLAESPYRWIEHTAWVIFEVSFLVPACMRLRNEIRELCNQQTELEHAKRSVDLQVQERTRELTSANESLALKTLEAEKLAFVAKYTDNAVIITDDKAIIEWVNDGFTRITGYEPEEAIGRTARSLLAGADTDPNILQLMTEGFEKQTGFDVEVIKYRKDKTPYWVAIENRPILDEEGRVKQFIAVESDITERINSENERQKLNEQLVDASRHAGMAEVATGVLHNVGNILNSVNVSASAIRKQFQRSSFAKLEKISGLIAEHEPSFAQFVMHDHRGQKIPAYLTRLTETLKSERSNVDNEFHDLLSNVDHIKQIVSVQQSMAKPSGLKQTLSPAALISDAVTANKGTLTNHDIEIRTNVSDDLPELVSDKHKILQILVNLIKNAKDALVESEAPNSLVTISVSADNKQFVFEVSDNGVGIPEDKINQIFQHGFTTKASGHGYGLHSSANAAVELGGSLTATSAGPGQGAIFSLQLPSSLKNPTEHNTNTTAGKA